MIGNTPNLTTPIAAGTAIPQATLNLPLPFFYGRDSGVALPTAALPYNEMRLNFSFRDYTELLVAYTAAGVTGVPVSSSGDLTTTPSITIANVWANYAIVSNDERKRMACAPRDILIEQVQTAPRQNFNPASGGNREPSFDIRFSHAIKVLFFAARNRTCRSDWSIYNTVSPQVTGAGPFTIDFEPNAAVDPIESTSLIYENTARLSTMGSDYFSLVNPYYNAPVIPQLIGYHSYSYSLDFICLDPMGSTNYGKLTNVSIIPRGSDGAVTASAGTSTTPVTGFSAGQTYEFIITAVNNNIIRISGGALGFPVL